MSNLNTSDIDLAQISSEKATELMNISLTYEKAHREAVYRKLLHAKNATETGHNELIGQRTSSPSLIRKINSYGDLWSETIAFFKRSYVPENVLEKIELMLHQMPSIIKKIYLELIESDSQLKTLEKQLNALKDTYQMAVEIISMLKEHSKEFLEEAFPSEECDINADVLIYKDLSFLQEEWES